MIKKDNKLLCNEDKIKNIFNKNYSVINNDIEKMIESILIDKKGKRRILEIILKRQENKNICPQMIDGFIYQKIIEKDDHSIIKELTTKLPNGIIHLKKSPSVNYQYLQDLLINQNFKEADKFTQQCLCKIVESKTNSKKNWLYFTDIQFIPKSDLFTLDLLWTIYSKGKFGFSIQKKIWLKNNKKWDKLWEEICWIKKGLMRRYPEEFIWNLDAPEGHLPLFNQLRGTQTLIHLLNHIDW
uniref:GUN4-like domain-containing protein n=1 Tax=Polysiphonia sp. TaxID=1967842 RepID=A0A1Z1MT08_9FLOR|nr:hypothetical protein [Polysiphonia sp.]